MEDNQEKVQRLEEDLFDLEKYISDIWRFLPIPIAYLNPLGIILDIDHSVLELLGYTEEEVIGRSLKDLFSRKKEIEDIEKETLRQGMTKDRELVIETKTNQEIPVYISTMARKEEGGEIIGYFVSMIDISEQKKAENNLKTHAKELEQKNKELEDAREAMLNILEDLEVEKNKLQEANVKSEAILSSIGDGIIATDKEGKVIIINKSAENMLGWSAKSIISKSVADFIPMQTEDELIVPIDKRPMVQALETSKKISTNIYYYVRKDKTRFAAGITVTPIILNRKTIGAIEVFRDITKERVVDKAKTEFVSLSSHQLRTPLSAISWYTEMLLAGDAGKINESQKKYLEEIYRGNKRMVELVNALLNVSRIELGTLAIEPQPTKITEIIDSVLSELQQQIKNKNLKLIKNYSPGLPKINIDIKLMRIVFENLLSNATKYTPIKGIITIIISAQKPDILIKIKDSGYGIPKEEQSKMFSKFFRANNVREKETEGTGLGLYIVKSVVEESGGTIRFESRENKGTTFYITFPLQGMKKKKGTKGLTESKF